MSMDGANAARRSNGARRGAEASARSRKCPRCRRKAALSARVRDDMGSVRECLYCGHQVGTMFGKSFGFDVPSEPGTRERVDES